MDGDPRAAKRYQMSTLRKEYEPQHDSRDEDQSQKSAQIEVYKDLYIQLHVSSRLLDE